MVGKKLWSPVSRLINWIISSPLDSFLAINESIALIDWEDIADRFAYHTGLVLNLITILCFAYYDISDSEDLDLADLFNDSDGITLNDIDILGQEFNNGIKIGSSYSYFGLLVKVTLTLCILLNLFNTFLYLSTTRSYHFQGNFIACLNEELESTSITKSIFTKAQENTISKWLFQRLESYLKFSGKTTEESTPEPEPINNPIARISYKLALWNPPKFTVMLFSIYSPLQLALLLLSPKLSFSSIALYAIITYSFYYMINKYETKIKDKDIINREVSKEYQEKFVKPRLSKKMVDSMVDATNPWSGGAQHFSPSVRNKIFLTHDFKGDLTDVLSPTKLPKTSLERMNGSRIATPMRQSVTNSFQYSQPFSTPFKTPMQNNMYPYPTTRTPQTASRIPVPIKTPSGNRPHNVSFVGATPRRPILNAGASTATPRRNTQATPGKLFPTTPSNQKSHFD